MSTSDSATKTTRTRRFWLITLAAVVGIAGTCALGRWQLDRAAEKIALQAAIDEKKSLPALSGSGLFAIENAADAYHQQARLRGTWQADATVYLDNRQLHGAPGFFVLTPLLPEGGGPAVVVQRGWAPRDFIDRAQLPSVVTPPGVVEVEGRIAPPPSRLLELGGKSGSAAATESSATQVAAGPGSGSSRIRQNLDLGAFAVEIGRPVFAASLLQTGPASEGLQRDWPEASTGVEKHYGYAAQWFGLAGLIALLYVWFQIVRRFYPPRR